MEGIVDGPMSQLLDWPATVFDDTVVDFFQLSGWREDDDEARNAVHDQSRLALTFAQSLLGALQIVDVDDQTVPVNDPPFAIIQRLTNGLNPSILTVGAPEFVDIVVRRARRDGMQPSSDRRVA